MAKLSARLLRATGYPHDHPEGVPRAAVEHGRSAFDKQSGRHDGRRDSGPCTPGVGRGVVEPSVPGSGRVRKIYPPGGRGGALHSRGRKHEVFANKKLVVNCPGLFVVG